MSVCSFDVQIGRANRKHERLFNSTALRTIHIASSEQLCTIYTLRRRIAQRGGTVMHDQPRWLRCPRFGYRKKHFTNKVVLFVILVHHDRALEESGSIMRPTSL